MGEPTGRSRAGSHAAVWVLLLPVALAWRYLGIRQEFDTAYLGAAAALALWAHSWRPRVGAAVCVALLGWSVHLAGWSTATRYALPMAALGLVAGLATGAFRPPARGERGSGLLAPALVPAATSLVAFALIAAHVLDPGSWLPAVAAAIAALAAVAVIGAGQRVPTPIGGALWGRWASGCARITALRRRWWSGEMPATAGESANPEPEVELEGDGSGGRSGLRGLRTPTGMWAAVFALVNLSRIVSPAPAPERSGWFDPDVIGRLGFRLESWIHYDANQYLDIAANGYDYVPGRYFLADGTQEPTAWMPGYALVIRAIHAVLPGVDRATIGVWITVVAGWAVAALFWTWTGQRGLSRRARIVSLWCLLLFPYSFFLYGAAYSDPLFLALVLGAFVLAESGRPLLGGLAGAAAGVVRVNVLALIAGFGAEAIRRRSARFAAAAALSASGLAAFVVWCWRVYDEPLLYWNAHSAIFGSFDVTNADQMVKLYFAPATLDLARDDVRFGLALVACGLVTVFCGLSLPACYRRFGAGPTAFVAMQVIIVWMGAYDFAGGGRYLAVSFPLAALWGEHLVSARPATRRVLAAVGVVWMLAMTYVFCRGMALAW